MKLIALKSLRYAGKSLLAGDSFEASAKDARLLKAIKKAGDAPKYEVAPETVDEPQRKARGKYRTRQMKAAEDTSDAPETVDDGVDEADED